MFFRDTHTRDLKITWNKSNWMSIYILLCFVCYSYDFLLFYATGMELSIKHLFEFSFRSFRNLSQSIHKKIESYQLVYGPVNFFNIHTHTHTHHRPYNLTREKDKKFKLHFITFIIHFKAIIPILLANTLHYTFC